MIVKNEERVIGACLESVKPFFSEIIIYDTGSTDRTVEICESFGATVIRGSWPDSFALARDESMRLAKGQWIMWLDADDTLPEHCGDLILHAVLSAHRDVVAYVVPVRFVEEQGYGTSVDHVKVFRNFPGLTWEGRIHEQILGSLRTCAQKAGISDGGQIGRLNAYVLHSGYDNSPEGQAKKRARDAKLLKLDLKDRPNHPFVLFNLGMTEHYSGNHEEAIKWLRKCISKSGPAESQLRKAYALLGASLRAVGKDEEARKVLVDGLAAVPGDPEIQFYLAQLAATRGEHIEAIALYEKVLTADISSVFTSIDPGIMGYKTRHNMAMAHLQLGDYPSARAQWVAAFEAEPRLDIVMTTFDAAAEHADLATCRQMLDWVRHHLGYSGEWAQMVQRLSQLTGLDPSAHFDAVLRMQPDNLEVRKAMAMHLLNSGQDEPAIPHFDFLQQRGVPEGAFFLGVIAEQGHDLQRALGWYEHAKSLNPAHLETTLRVQRLRDQLYGT